MIDVLLTFHESGPISSVRISGHAQQGASAAPDRPLCAAVSALEDTFEASAMLLGKSSRRATKGAGFFEWTGLEQESEAVRLFAASLVLGLERLAAAHEGALTIRTATLSRF